MSTPPTPVDRIAAQIETDTTGTITAATIGPLITAALTETGLALIDAEQSGEATR